MTRSEAIQLLKAVVDKHSALIGERSIEASLDGYEALGLIKFDQEPSVDARINNAINTELFYGKREKCAGNIKKALDAAGFKIVEKCP